MKENYVELSNYGKKVEEQCNGENTGSHYVTVDVEESHENDATMGSHCRYRNHEKTSTSDY